MKPIILIFALFLIISTSAISQVRLSHVSNYGGGAIGNSFGTYIKTDKFGNYYVAGRSATQNTKFDYALVKYSSDGNMLWERRYNGEANGNDEPLSLYVDREGHAFITGYSMYLKGQKKLLESVTIKYSPDGEIIWTNKYRSNSGLDVKGHSVTVNPHGDVFVSAYIGTSSSMDFLLLKLTSDGETVWERTFTANSYRTHYSDKIFATKNHVYVCGGAVLNPTNALDMIVLKYDLDGNLIWFGSHNGNIDGTDIAKSVFVDKNENVYITGYTENRGTKLDITTLKFNPAGTLLWATVFNGTGDGFDWSNHVLVDDIGNVYVEGGSQNEREKNPECEADLGKCRNDATLIKYLPTGEIDWVRLYNGPDDMYDCYQGIALDKDNNIYVAGRSHNEVGTTNDDIITAKYNSRGDLIWFMKYNSAPYANDYGAAIAIDDFGNVYTSGWSDVNWVSHFTVLKYSPSKFYFDELEIITIDNHPNPFNPVTKIKFSLPSAQFTKLKVYNTAGQEVTTLVNQHLQPGSYEYTFDATGLASGVYFYRLEAGEFVQTKRMLLIK